MTDTQLMTIIFTLLAIGAGIWQNRRTVDDMRDVLRAEFKAEIATLRMDIIAVLQRIENKLDHVVDTQADHSARLGKLEGKL